MQANKLTPTPFNNIMAEFEETSLIHGILNIGDFIVLSGAPNAGKTFLALDWALHISAGWPWFGKEVEQGAVVYVSCEGGRRFAYRIEAFKQYYAADLKDKQLPFGLINRPVNLYDPNADLAELIQECNLFALQQAAPLRLVIIDTLSRAMAGADENSPQGMTQFVQNIDQIRTYTDDKTAVCIVHHVGKDESRGARGHSALFGATDTECRVRQNRTTKVVTLEMVKQRDADTSTEYQYNLTPIIIGKDKKSLDISSCIVTEYIEKSKNVNVNLNTAAETKKKSESRLQLYTEVMQKFYDQMGYAPRVAVDDEFRQTLIANDGLTYNAAKQAGYTAAQQTLAKQQWVMSEGNWLPVKGIE